MLHFRCLLIISVFSPFIFYAQKNNLNKKGQRSGKWVTYLDSAKKIKSSEGRYRNGEPKGKFYYYTDEGVLERKETSRFSKLKTTTYYSNHTIRSKGNARIEILPDKIHYYYYGKWRYYDINGNLEKYCYYENGNLVQTAYLNKSIKTNDSLTNALNTLDQYFNRKNAALLDSISRSAFNILRRERLQMELYMIDTLSFKTVEKILENYSYPSKEVTGEATVIPYYILSFAPTGIREKYLPLLKAAADKGDLEWKSLAFYIDKLELAKGKKQIYGTQYYYKQNQIVYYPVVDAENLELRRKKVGL